MPAAAEPPNQRLGVIFEQDLVHSLARKKEPARRKVFRASALAL